VIILTTVEIIKQDLSVAKKYLEDGKYGLITILGNRIMSNLMVGGETDLMIVGWLMKEVGRELSIINNYESKEEIKEAKKSGEEFITNITKQISEEDTNIEKIYDEYFEYQKKIRKYTLKKPEDKYYKDDLDFTRKNTIFCLEYLVRNKGLLLDPRTQFLLSCAADLARVLNEHGGQKVDYVTYLLFKAFDRYFDYLLFRHNVEGVIEDKERFTKIVDGHLKTINILIKNLDNESEFIKIADGLLGEFGYKYREFVMKFGDIYREFPVRMSEKKIEIPLDTREKIVEIISKSFQKEAK